MNTVTFTATSPAGSSRTETVTAEDFATRQQDYNDHGWTVVIAPPKAKKETTTMQTRGAIIKKAKSQVADWPQYCQHFGKEYRVGVILNDVTTKFGLAFEKGEMVIAKQEPGYIGPRTIFAWSIKNKIDTAIQGSDILFIK